MPTDPNRPNTPAWRKGVSSPSAKRSAQPEWRKEPQAPATASTGRWTRQTKLGVGACSLLILSGLLIWVVYWLIPPKPACLVLIGAGYEENLAVPHNVYGWGSLDGLRDLAGSSASSWLWWKSGLLRLLHEPSEFRTDAEWDRGLEQVPEKTILLYLALHGGADSQGAYLLPHDADLLKENRVRIDKVFDRLEQVPPAKNVVLMVDATQVPANGALGMLHNDFARGLHAQKERIEKIPNLVVFSASDTDQRSWVSEEWRRTIFAHYVIEGLKGGAAQQGSRRISALDLFQYVSRNVARWVRANRDSRQTPVLLGGEDRAQAMELTAVEAYAPSDPEEAPGFKEAPDFTALTQAWRACDDLQKLSPSPAVYAPHIWRRYQDTLIRYEQLIRAGATRKAPDLKRSLDQLAADLRDAQQLELAACPYNALGMPAALGWEPVATTKQLTAWVEDLWRTPDAELDGKWEQIQKEAGAKHKQLLRLHLSGLLLERAAANPSPADLQKACSLQGVIGASGNQRAAEPHFLTMLQRDLDDQSWPPEDLLRRALRLRVLAENAALAINPDLIANGNVHPYSEFVVPWIRAQVSRAE